MVVRIVPFQRRTGAFDDVDTKGDADKALVNRPGEYSLVFQT